MYYSGWKFDSNVSVEPRRPVDTCPAQKISNFKKEFFFILSSLFVYTGLNCGWYRYDGYSTRLVRNGIRVCFYVFTFYSPLRYMAAFKTVQNVYKYTIVKECAHPAYSSRQYYYVWADSNRGRVSVGYTTTFSTENTLHYTIIENVNV